METINVKGFNSVDHAKENLVLLLGRGLSAPDKKRFKDTLHGKLISPTAKETKTKLQNRNFHLHLAFTTHLTLHVSMYCRVEPMWPNGYGVGLLGRSGTM